LQVACEQACPTGAIVFGDIADESTRVSQAKKLSRTYGLLTDLNTHPRTTYLARVRNPNPKLGKAEG
jgi:molybdopterin-containing oxidoreductase family iron-sulfur binding subunit